MERSTIAGGYGEIIRGVFTRDVSACVSAFLLFGMRKKSQRTDTINASPPVKNVEHIPQTTLSE